MDLRVSVVLIFIFLTGGYSLKCYTCESDSKGYCDAKVETCPAGSSKWSKCGKTIVEQSDGSTVIAKGCAPECDPVTQIQTELGTVTLHCCDTDLCNAADGVYKGSFLLLFSPLLFYFLFQ